MFLGRSTNVSHVCAKKSYVRTWSLVDAQLVNAALGILEDKTSGFDPLLRAPSPESHITILPQFIASFLK